MKLIIEDDEGKTTVYPLGDREVTVGRKEGNTIRLMERNVSRRHARLFELGGRLVIEDLDSYNGIRLNGERVMGRAEVGPGDLMEIGDYHIGLQPDDEDEDTFDVPVADAAPTPLLRPADGEEATQPTPGLDPTDPRADAEANTAEEDFHSPETEGPRLFALSPEPRLICVSTEYSGLDFALRADGVIGRIEESDVVIEHPSVSRSHARITERDGSFEIVDLESANGVLVNGQPATAHVLESHDLIELGHVLLRYVPSREVFRPTADELDAIEAAGVRFVDAEDPSRAETVTDRPLEQLPTPVFSRGLEEPGHETMRLPRMAAWPIPNPSSSGIRPPFTPSGPQHERPGPPRSVASPASPPRDLERSGPRAPSWAVPAAGGLGAVLLGGVLWFWLAGGASETPWDRALRQQFDAGDLPAVLQTWDEHRGQFGNPDEAQRLVRTAEERYVQDLLRQANAAIDRSDDGAAIPLLQRCLDRVPQMTACHWSLGVAYARSNQPDLAAQHYQRFVELAPDDARAASVREVLDAYRSGDSAEVQVP